MLDRADGHEFRMRISPNPKRTSNHQSACVGYPMKDWRERILIDPRVCHGKPCIKGTRTMVWIIVGCLANGDSVEEVLAAYPSWTREDVQAALAYAGQMARERYVDIPISQT